MICFNECKNLLPNCFIKSEVTVMLTNSSWICILTIFSGRGVILEGAFVDMSRHVITDKNNRKVTVSCACFFIMMFESEFVVCLKYCASSEVETHPCTLLELLKNKMIIFSPCIVFIAGTLHCFVHQTQPNTSQKIRF